MYSYGDLTRVWDTLTCWLSNGVLKWLFLQSGLAKSFTVSNITKGDIFEISFLKSDEKMQEMRSYADFNRVWDSLTC